jgi:hypothetical protein
MPTICGATSGADINAVKLSKKPSTPPRRSREQVSSPQYLWNAVLEEFDQLVQLESVPSLEEGAHFLRFFVSPMPKHARNNAGFPCLRGSKSQHGPRIRDSGTGNYGVALPSGTKSCGPDRMPDRLVDRRVVVKVGVLAVVRAPLASNLQFDLGSPDEPGFETGFGCPGSPDSVHRSVHRGLGNKGFGRRGKESGKHQ